MGGSKKRALFTPKSINGRRESTKVIVAMFAAMLMMFNFASCGTNNDEPPTIAVSGITVSPTTLTLKAGGTNGTLTATVTPTNATDKTVTWSSSNESVATVSNGVVSPKTAGTATITAKAGLKTATCTITVEKVVSIVNVASVSLDKTTVELTEGGSETLAATVKPDNATNQNVVWTSSDTAIATVDNNGKVTAVKKGTATITVKTEDGAKTATCSVTIKAAAITVPVSGVTLDKTTWSLAVGESETLSATIAPTTATNKTVTWSSSNATVATVDANGKVTAIKAGTTTITIKTEDGNKTATCAVTVTSPLAEVYAGGYVPNASGKNVATLWKNGTAKPLSDGTSHASINSVYVSGSDVYVGGYVPNASGKNVATLWTNGTAKPLSDGTTNVEIKSVYVSGSDVYAGGYAYNASNITIATIWKNGTAQPLSDGTSHACINSVYVSGSDVYVGGYAYNASNITIATIWKNGTAQPLSDGTTNARVLSLFVTE